MGKCLSIIHINIIHNNLEFSPNFSSYNSQNPDFYLDKTHVHRIEIHWHHLIVDGYPPGVHLVHAYRLNAKQGMDIYTYMHV